MGKRNSALQDVVAQEAPNERKQAWLDEEIQVEFYNLEEPGLSNKFAFGTTKNFKNYTLLHGSKYTLPRRVVQHVESRQTPIWKWLPDGAGGMRKECGGYKPRFQCRQIFV